MKTTIFIEEITVDAIIGVYKHERQFTQPLVIDIEMQYDSQQASASDNIKHALDYHKICDDVYLFVNESSFQLLETLAEKIAEKILNNPFVENVCVKISKPQALESAKNVGVVINRSNY